MSDRYAVVYGNYRNDNVRSDYIQAVGTYNDFVQAYGAALLMLNDNANEDLGETITPLFPLEGDTGYGMELKHERYTDFCYVLFINPNKSEINDKYGGN